MSQVWFVTGSSRGLGYALIKKLLEDPSGFKVVATARTISLLDDLVKQYGSDRLLALKMDVTDRDEIAKVVSKAVEVFGRLDVVVNNAGYGIHASLEETPIEMFRQVIDANFYGVVNVTQAVLPYLRKQRSGHILNVSSIGGRLGSAGLGAYQSAKWAVEGFSEVLVKESSPFNVRVTIIEPGGLRTDWAGPSMTFVTPGPDYEPSVGMAMKFMEAVAGSERGDPERAAAAIIQVTQLAEPPVHLLLGSDAFFLANAISHARIAEDAKHEALSVSSDFPGLPPAAEVLAGFLTSGKKLPSQ